MTAPETLVELAERVLATGPDRRLDAMIGAAVRQMPIGQPDAFVSAWPNDFIPAQFKGSIAAPDDKGGTVVHWEALSFTGSLDAAMTLYLHVPERIPADPRKAAAEGLRQRAMDAALKARAQAKDSK